ncbi:unnamed protein product [Enterobius vermicularis]|uniref:tRNA (guanine-N(7)-)-methyltransferase non-catalytic subunit n=1 Tax=Enterobius vermicularis TaxID=51028 RepID=A0A0N4V1D6_ENTVE|nr:unnamed protein product [Enterobius vermicularis]
MAKIFCSSDSIVVAADTTLFVFQYAITDANLHIELTRTVDVDIKLTTVPDSEVVEDDDENAAEAVNSLNEKKQKLPEAEKQVLDGHFSADGMLFAVVTSMKTCVVYDTTRSWELKCAPFRLPKAPTSVVFDSTSTWVIVGDRAGSVIRYGLEASEKKEEAVDGKRGELLLGHVSMVLDIAISPCDRYIASSDRDEKIRISRYPQTFVIHRFCLGHESYVNCVTFVKNLLFSSGGDGTVRVWHTDDGSLTAVCNFFVNCRIRVTRILPSGEDIFTIIVLCEESDFIDIVRFDYTQKTFIKSVTLAAAERVTDVDFLPQSRSFVVLTRGGFYFGFVEENPQMKAVANFASEVKTLLKSAKEISLSLEKRIGFNNVEEYHQRKNERILKRKRPLESPIN